MPSPCLTDNSGPSELTRCLGANGREDPSILGLIAWFAALDKTEQAIVLDQVDGGDFAALADQLVKRHRR